MNARSRTTWIGVLLLACTSSCDWQCPGNESSSHSTPPVYSTLTYSDLHPAYWATLPIAPDVATLVGFDAGTYSVAPSLPAGLALDPTTGAISGTPLEPQESTAYTISVTNGAASDPLTAHCQVTIAVYDDVPPSNLTYALNPAVYATSTAAPANVPAFDGHADLFEVAPPLPYSLTLDALSGVVSGFAGQDLGITQHVVTASNPFGSTQVTLEIEVVESFEVRGLAVLHGDAGDGASIATFAPWSPYYSRGMVDYAGCAGQPLDMTLSRDGRFAYALLSDGHIERHAVDLDQDRIGPPVQTFLVLDAKLLGFAEAQDRLIVAGTGFVASFAVAPDGSLSDSMLATGPANPAVLAVDPAGDYCAVGSSGPFALQIYDLATLVPRGAPVTIANDVYVTGAGVNTASSLLYAGGYHYDGSPASGRVYRLEVASAAEVAAGAPAVDETQTVTIGGLLSHVAVAEEGGLFRGLVACDASSDQVHFLKNQSGTFLDPVAQSWQVGSNAERVLYVARNDGGDEDEVVVLSPGENEIRIYGRSFVFDPFTPKQVMRTRSLPLRMARLRHANANFGHATAFVASGADSTVQALSFDDVPNGFGVWASQQAPVATGAEPVRVARHPELDVVYTANQGAGSVSAFTYNRGAGTLAPLAEEQLGGFLPNDLAFDASGRFAFVASAPSSGGGGRVLGFAVSPQDGTLTPTGNVIAGLEGAPTQVAIEPTARFVYAVLPNDGAVESFRIGANGALFATGTLYLVGRPSGIALVPNGCQAFVCDSQLAQVVRCDIDPSSGALTAVGAAFSIGVEPQSLRTAQRIPTLSVLDATGGAVRWAKFDLLTGALSADSSPQLPITGASADLAWYYGGSGYGAAVVEELGGAAQLTSYHWYVTIPLEVVQTLPLGGAPLSIDFRWEKTVDAP